MVVPQLVFGFHSRASFFASASWSEVIRMTHRALWLRCFLHSLLQARTIYRPGHSPSVRHPHAQTGGQVFFALDHVGCGAHETDTHPDSRTGTAQYRVTPSNNRTRPPAGLCSRSLNGRLFRKRGAGYPVQEAYWSGRWDLNPRQLAWEAGWVDMLRATPHHSTPQ